MARRIYLFLCSFAMIVVFIGGVVAAGARGFFIHPGRVLEMSSNKPVAADIKAWPDSKQTGSQGDCPLFGISPLYATQSEIQTEGQFRLDIDSEANTYTATYCAQGFYPRADRDLRNRDNGSKVLPFPVRLVKRGEDIATLEPMLRDRVVSFLNDLAYYRSVDAEKFGKIMKSVAEDVGKNSPQRAKAVMGFAEAVSAWSE